MTRNTLGGWLAVMALVGGCASSAPAPSPSASPTPGPSQPGDDSGAVLPGGTDSGGADTGVAEPAPPTLLVEDEGALLAWIHQGAARLELRSDGGAWSAAPGPAGDATEPGAWYWLPADALPASPDRIEARVVTARGHSPTTTPGACDAVFDLGARHIPLGGDDQVTASIQLPASLTGAAGDVGLYARLHTVSGDVVGWVTEACGDGSLDDCLSSDTSTVHVDDLAAVNPLPALRARHDEAATLQLDAVVQVAAIGPDGDPLTVPLSEFAAAPLPSSGRTLAWGDLHAHSNLSYDGCEMDDGTCDPRQGSGAGDFFDQAAKAGLDFVALTDHAEWGRYYPDGLDGASVDIWEEQRRLVQLADEIEDGPIPFLGYEWTNWRSRPVDTSTDYEGGHKTVIFQSIDVDEDFRIGAGRVDDTLVKGSGVYTRSETTQTASPSELYALLDEANAAHGETPLLSFFHHPTCEAPQGVDFGNHASAPDPRYEPLVEIYSEHGNSECVDLDAEDCDWRINHGAFTYLPRGSVQYALKMGFHLGFTAGTDSHDARPGSWEDGPGLHATAGEGYPAPSTQFAPGGLTGVWLSAEPSREGIFTALRDRATVATTGPRPDVRVLAVDQAGLAWLPGAVLPTPDDDLRVVAHVEEGDGLHVDHMSLVDQTGATLRRVEGGDLDTTVDLDSADACYLRVVLHTDDTEHRLWVSPFFIAP